MLQTSFFYAFSKDSVCFALYLLFSLSTFSDIISYPPGLLKRSPILTSSKLIENILKNNETRRLKSYVEAGCINIDDAARSTRACKFTSSTLLI